MLSSFEVYGNAYKDIYKESDSGVIEQNMIRSCYPESKRCMELLTRCYVEEYGVNALIGRLCSIYGPTMLKDDSKAHAQFIKNALRGEDIVLKSKGEQQRTYCYVLDAVTGILCALGKGAIGDAYNISNDESIVTIAEVAKTVADIIGTRVVFDIPDEIEKKGFSKPQNCILDNQKLKTLGWKGKYDIKTGLKECIIILKENDR
jgi:nucleoside-diphosphate-sugar epimerase